MRCIVAAAVLPCVAGLMLGGSAPLPAGAAALPVRGLTAAALVAHAYDAVLNAEFDRLPDLITATCGDAPAVACLALRALGTWWEIQLDAQNRALDGRFSREVDLAVEQAEAWTRREPERAEAWLYLGISLGARGQWKVLRDEYLAAARDGKRVKEALEQALQLDPGLDDAAFGIGVYRYYAAIKPAYVRWFRVLLMLPGGNRAEGLALMERASRSGQLVRGEADYQLHLVYLWYEQRFAEALTLVTGLRERYPRNPHFRHLEASIADVYFHDAARSLAASQSLLAAAEQGDVNRAEIAEVRARLNIAEQFDRLGARERARTEIDTLLSRRLTAPAEAIARARTLQREWSRR